MIDLYISLLPVFLFFILGMVLRRVHILDGKQPAVILRFVFFATIPAILLANISSMKLGAQDMLLPTVAIAVVVINLPVSWWLFKNRTQDPNVLGSLILSSMVINNAFMIPFMYWGFGTEGLGYVLIYEIGVALVQASFVYGLAFRLSEHSVSAKVIAQRVASSPPLWGVFLALLLSFTATEIPSPIMSFLKPLGDMTGPLLLVALGASFSIQKIKLGWVLGVMSLRVVLGGTVGFILGSLFGFEGMLLMVATLSSAAPIGFTATTFAVLAKLDFQLAATMSSISLILAFFYIPLLMSVLSMFLLD